MNIVLLFEQLLNGVQFGTQLFLMAAGLTLVFGIMNMINLAHGSLYMAGAFVAATTVGITGNFFAGVLAGAVSAGLLGAALEFALLRRFYAKTHLDQVLVTFGLILILNDVTRLIWGNLPLPMPLPDVLSGSVGAFIGLHYPAYRLVVLGIGLAIAAALYFAINHTRVGMWVRAGASDRVMASAMGVNVDFVFAIIFASGAALAGLAGLLSGPINAVQVGMGEPILILALVVTVVGGLGSIKGAFVAAMMIGLVDTFGRVLLPPALGTMAIFVLMAVVLAFRPKGLFPAYG